MSPDERSEMEKNLLAISYKVLQAQELLRKMRARWDQFRQKHKHLVPLVHARYFRLYRTYILLLHIAYICSGGLAMELLHAGS